MLERWSPDLSARRAVLAAVQARLGATGFWAPLTVSGGIEEVPGAAFTNARSARVEVSREFAPGLGGARRALVQADVERATLELDLARRRLLARAAQHLTRAVGATAIVHRLAAEDSLLVATEDALRARFAIGAARYVDVLRIRTERLRVQSELAAAKD